MLQQRLIMPSTDWVPASSPAPAPPKAHCALGGQALGHMAKVNVHHAFEALRAEGPLQLIGAEAGVLEDKWRRCDTRPPLQRGRSVGRHPPLLPLACLCVWTGLDVRCLCRWFVATQIDLLTQLRRQWNALSIHASAVAMPLHRRASRRSGTGCYGAMQRLRLCGASLRSPNGTAAREALVDAQAEIHLQVYLLLTVSFYSFPSHAEWSVFCHCVLKGHGRILAP